MTQVDTEPTPVVVAPPHRRRHRLRWAIAAIIGIPVLYLGVTFLQVWHDAHQDEARPSGAIVVLGAAQYNGRPSPVLQLRLDHGLELYRRGLAPVIVVTGGRRPGDRYTEATTGYNYFRQHGVPDSAIRKEVQGRTTYESLAAAKRFLQAEGIRNVLLVSGPAYSTRLRGIARDVGLRAVTSPSVGHPTLHTYLRETGAVALGRITGYRRLERIDH